MNNLSVTVVVPVYNIEEKVLNQCFQSLAVQTMNDFELIVVDDGSSQETFDCLERMTEMYQFMRVIHQSNGGASVARNTGLALAKGEFVTFVDADDWVEKDYLERMRGYFTDPDTDITLCTRMFEYKNRSEPNHFLTSDHTFTAENRQELIHHSIIGGIAGTWCKMYRLSFLREHHLTYDVCLRRTQDIIFNLYAFMSAKKIVYHDECLYHYRMDNGSVTKKYNPRADEVLTKAAEAFRTFGEIYYPDNIEIQKDIRLKQLNIMHEILKLHDFNPSNPEPRTEIYRHVKQLTDREVYRTAIENTTVRELPSKLWRLRLTLLKGHRWGALRLLYRIQLEIEHRRNYS